MRKSLILASLLASATAVNAEIYIDGGVNWTFYTPKPMSTPAGAALGHTKAIFRHSRICLTKKLKGEK